MCSQPTNWGTGAGDTGGLQPHAPWPQEQAQCPTLLSAPSPYFKGDMDQKMSSPNTSCRTDENAVLQPT